MNLRTRYRYKAMIEGDCQVSCVTQPKNTAKALKEKIDILQVSNDEGMLFLGES